MTLQVPVGGPVQFRDRKICVTGGRGALGARLVQHLLDCGVERVVTLSRQAPPSNGPALDSRVEHLVGSVLDAAALDTACRGCAVVFHLAALTNVEASRVQAARYFEINTLGTVQVLEACQRCGVSRLVYASTAHLYGMPRELPITEDHPAAPRSAYAASKLAGEIALQVGSAQTGVRCEIARLPNVYGASFDERTVIGHALIQAAAGGPIRLRDLTPVRDFIHVDDVVTALVCLASSDPQEAGCRIMNVSSGCGVSVAEMAGMLSRVAAEEGLGAPAIIDGRVGPDGVPALILNNSRIRTLTGWTPQVALQDGLRRSLRELQPRLQTLS